MTALPMIIRCYYHQHPEDYGRGYVDEPALPAELRYGRAEDVSALVSTTGLMVEPMGHPEAVAL